MSAQVHMYMFSYVLKRVDISIMVMGDASDTIEYD